MAISEEAVLKIVNDHLRRVRGAGPVTADAGLLSEGHLDSFGLAELTAELEAGLGITLSDGALLPEDFESVRALYQRLVEVTGA